MKLSLYELSPIGANKLVTQNESKLPLPFPLFKPTYPQKTGNEEDTKMKKGVIKDNRVLMLEKIMKKNFTHGKIMTEIK